MNNRIMEQRTQKQIKIDFILNVLKELFWVTKWSQYLYKLISSKEGDIDIVVVDKIVDIMKESIKKVWDKVKKEQIEKNISKLEMIKKQELEDDKKELEEIEKLL